VISPENVPHSIDGPAPEVRARPLSTSSECPAIRPRSATIQTKDTRQGIAAVTAMAQPSFPSEAGKTSYASNVGYYRGEVGFSAGVMHRFDGDFALTAGISYAGGENTAVRAGIAGEF
jgi:hypothetical protein